MKHRLLVMNGQCSMQQEDQGQWRNVKVEKAGGVKLESTIFIRQTRRIKQKNIQALSCMADKTTVYQQVGKGQYITHDRQILQNCPKPERRSA